MPISKEQCLATLYISLLVLNYLLPVFQVCVLIILNWVETSKGVNLVETSAFWGWALLVSRYGVGVLQLMSGIFLLVAVYRIRKFMNGSQLGSHIDHGIMAVHAVSFTVYILAIIAYYTAFYLYLRAVTK